MQLPLPVSLGMPKVLLLSVGFRTHLKAPVNLSSGECVPPGGEAHGRVRPPD